MAKIKIFRSKFFFTKIWKFHKNINFFKKKGPNIKPRSTMCLKKLFELLFNFYYLLIIHLRNLKYKFIQS